jgi:hypothetical protein
VRVDVLYSASIVRVVVSIQRAHVCPDLIGGKGGGRNMGRPKIEWDFIDNFARTSNFIYDIVYIQIYINFIL